MNWLQAFFAALFPKKPPVISESRPIISESAKFIAQWEGCKLRAYQDVAGVWTIGFGHTEGVRPGDVITQAQADAWLADEVARFERGVLASLTRQPTPNQLAAMTSLAFNVGISAFRGSTVARKFDQGDLAGAAEAFKLWNRAGGQVVKGLVNRRAAEAALFLAD